METRWLQSFVAVADEMHFSRAARNLNLAQPALTAQIHQLERAVGAKLFVRTNRVEGLTAAGRALLPEAKAIVAHLGRLDRVARRAAKGETGRLRIGIIPPAAISPLAESVRRYAAKFPEVELSVQQGDQAFLLGRLANRELDLVIARPTPRGGHDGELRQRRLFREEQGILVRESDPLAKGGPVRLTRLDGMKLLLLQGNPHFGQLLLGHAYRHGATLTPWHGAQDFPSLHWMVRSGLGVAPCSLLLADSLPRGLVAVPLSPPPPKIYLNAIWPGAKPAPPVTSFLELLAS